MKKILLGAAALAACLATAPASAQESPFGLSVSAGVVSEYFFRGFSQSDDNPAFQAGAEGTYALNETYSLYGGIWGSTVDFNEGTDAEIDPYFGIRATYDALGIDVGVIRYMYADAPDGSDYDFTEIKLIGSYDLGYVVPSAGVYYSPDYYNGTGDSTYIFGGLTVPLPVTQFEPKIVANVGKQYIDDNAKWGTDDYVDWNIGLFASYWGFTAGVQYVDTNVKTSQCPEACDAAAVFSLGYSYSF